MDILLLWWWVVPFIFFKIGWDSENTTKTIVFWFTALGIVLGHFIHDDDIGSWWVMVPACLYGGFFIVRKVNYAYMLECTAIGCIIGYYLQ